MDDLPAFAVGHRDRYSLRGKAGGPGDGSTGVHRHAGRAAGQHEIQRSRVGIGGRYRIGVQLAGPDTNRKRLAGDGGIHYGLQIRRQIVRCVVDCAALRNAIDPASGIAQSMLREYRPDGKPIRAAVGGQVRREDRVTGVRHAGIAGSCLQSIDHQLVGGGLTKRFPEVPQRGCPNFAVVMHFVTGITHILVRKRVAFIALAPDTMNRVVRYIGAQDGIIEEADREIVGPPLSHGSRLNLNQATCARLAAHQPVGDAVAVFVNHHLAVVVAIQIVGKGRGGLSEYAHP